MPRGRARKKSGRRGRPTLLSSVSIVELKRELDRRQGRLIELKQQHEALTTELRELEEVFGISAEAANGRWGKRTWRGRARVARGSGRRAGRGRNANSLVSTLQSTLAGSTMSVSDAAEKVRKDGYHTKSANFRTIVNQALLSHPDVFKKVARGQYTAR
ncbi:MAG: hypothetical protein L0Y42_09110 [Phycisphaerales bacterium]|nr:hypothetical protein [Phycisphaerales bacterium]